MIVEELIRLLEKEDPKAFVVTSSAEYITEVTHVGSFSIGEDKLVEVNDYGEGANQWIGAIADHTGKIISEGYRTPPIPKE